MGQKIHPVGFRLGITQEHQSRWFADPDRYPELLQEDYKLRQYIEQKLGRLRSKQCRNFRSQN